MGVFLDHEEAKDFLSDKKNVQFAPLFPTHLRSGVVEKKEALQSVGAR